MSAPVYDYIAIEDGTRVVAHVFVAPQDLHGLDIGYVEAPGKGKSRRRVSGDVFIGNKDDGYYTLNFEMTVEKGVDSPLDLGGKEYDLSAGRCFVVGAGYAISQLPCQTRDEALALLER